MTTSKDEITIVIPTLNEAPSIAMVIEEVRQEGYNNILVVDGHSSDGTVEHAIQSGANVIVQHGKGKCDAIKIAIEHVKTPYMLVMSAGHTYDPKDIRKFLSRMENYDMIIGFPESERENIPRLNRYGSLVITKIFNFLFGTSLHRVASGIYLLRTGHVKRLAIRSSDFGIDVEIAAQSALRGKLAEVPVSYRKRIGEAKLPLIKAAAEIMRDMLNAYNMLSSFDPRPSVIGALIMVAIAISSRMFFALETTPIIMMLSVGVFISTWGLEIIVKLLKLIVRA